MATSPVATTLLVLNLDSIAQRHLARALEDHGRWCKANGIAVPTALEQLGISVSSGQSRSHQPDEVNLVDTGAMKVAYTFSETGQLLGVSESTIRRLVRSHQLRAVSVAGSRRIHREDLESFADALRRQEAS